jgi:subtilisin family serine protease
MPRVFSNQQSSDYTGNNQWAVAILDTGVDKNHQFLKTGSTKKVISEACYSGIDGAAPPSQVQSFCPGGSFSSTASGSGVPCTLEGCEHGTHVAGIAVGDGASFDGAARLGKIIAIKVFSRINDFSACFPGPSPCALVATSDLIKGLERVYALRNTFKIAAVNLSLGGGAFSGSCNGEPEKQIIDRLKAVKIATVVASGNAGESSKISSPACISSAIAVGSSLDDADVKSSFSNSSSTLDLYAPGSNITSSVPGGGFVEFDGTSMAAPHVAGAWAVIRHALPNATVNQIEAAFKQVGPAISHNGVSRRRIDIRAALKALGVEEGAIVITPILGLLLLQ